MKDKYLLELKKTIKEFLKDKKIRIFLFGSRARRDNYIFSDVDIGILTEEKIDKGKISLLREKLENSNIPYKVDLVDLKEVSDDFRKEILKGAILWKD